MSDDESLFEDDNNNDRYGEIKIYNIEFLCSSIPHWNYCWQCLHSFET